jgi:hypothetical protein
MQVFLGVIDAAYSGDWSRIGAISKGKHAAGYQEKGHICMRKCSNTRDVGENVQAQGPLRRLGFAIT